MKNRNKLFSILIACLVSVISVYAKNNVSYTGYAYTCSEAEAVIELDSLRFLHVTNENAKLPMASTTKILTAITVIDNIDINKELTVPEACAGVEGSSIYLKAGEKLTVKELLYGLMLRSGNDCAETLAVAGFGSILQFTKLMNETAVKVGANDSNFVNPHGLPDKNHYTTAHDLALISAYAMKNATFKEIVSTKRVEIRNGEEDYPRVLINKNKMLSNFDGANGVKTGYTKAAGRCLVSSAERNGTDIICVVINSPQMWERSGELLNNAFSEYKVYKIVDSSAFHYCLPVKNTYKYCETYIKEDFSYPLTSYEKENLDIKVEMPDSLRLPVAKDAEIGKIEIYSSKQLIFSEKIYTLISI